MISIVLILHFFQQIVYTVRIQYNLCNVVVVIVVVEINFNSIIIIFVMCCY